MKSFIIAILIAIIFFVNISSVLARSGCCSHHGGVVGCGCGDGTPLSSTCAPYYPECSGSSSNNSNYVAPVYNYNLPTSTPVPPTATPYPTNTPTPTDTPIPTSTSIPIFSTQAPIQEVAGANTSSNNSTGSTILRLIILSGLIGGIYYKNKKDKAKTTPE